MTPQAALPVVELPALPVLTGAARLRLWPGTLARLGPWALLAYARHRLARAELPDRQLPVPPFLCDAVGADPGIGWFPGVPEADRARPALELPTLGGFDMRQVWEAGRLVDLPVLAGREPAAAEAVVRSFVAASPPFRGPHWACGQEASIRLVHLLAAQRAVGGRMLPGFLALVALHRARIAATLHYAIAQDNNHATSEAAGLWLCGVVLGDAEAAARGRELLQRVALRLFHPDGAFSQQSMRYQLAALEMAASAQAFCLGAGGPGLSGKAMARLAAGVAWLARLVDPTTGLAWRVGQDDSSRFLGDPPDDLRPALARLRGVFGGGVSGEGVWVDRGGGFAGLSAAPVALVQARPVAAKIFLRLPVHRFRPSQADALHLELWLDGHPVLTDAGSAAYNVPGAPDLARTAAHNTVAFDDDDQMPKLSRFLYAGWLRPKAIAATDTSLSAAYTDWRGRRHARTALLAPNALTVTDLVSGSFRRAMLRWRLPEGSWRLAGNELAGERLSIRIEGAASLRLVRLPFAPCYGSWTATPALEAWVEAPGRVTSHIRWPVPLAPATGTA